GAAEQGVLDFLDEQSLAAHLGKRPVLQPIAVGLDDDDPAGRTAGGSDARRDRVGLPESELAPARAETKLVGVHVAIDDGRGQRRPVGRLNASTRPPFGPRSRSDGSSPGWVDKANSRVSASVYVLTASELSSDFSCSVGVNSSFSTMRCVISSTRARA